MFVCILTASTLDPDFLKAASAAGLNLAQEGSCVLKVKKVVLFLSLLFHYLALNGHLERRDCCMWPEELFRGCVR